MNNDTADRKSALLLFDLPEDATQEEIDKKYYILMKKYRVDQNKEMLESLAFAYDVLNGKIDEKLAKEAEWAKAKKYLGKTASEWRTYIGYTWWQYALAVLGTVLVIYLVLNAIFKESPDLQVVSIGHFTAETETLSGYAKENLGFSNPTVTSVDLIVDPDIEQNEMTMHGYEIAMAQLSVKPDVLITDRMTMPRYLEIMRPLDDFYEELEKELPPEQFSQIEPVRMKLAEFREMTTLEGEDVEYEPGDEVEYIYGLMLREQELIYGYGYYSLWPPYEEPEKQKDPTLRDPSLIFTLTVNANEPEKGEAFVKDILSNQEHFQTLAAEKITAQMNA